MKGLQYPRALPTEPDDAVSTPLEPIKKHLHQSKIGATTTQSGNGGCSLVADRARDTQEYKRYALLEPRLSQSLLALRQLVKASMTACSSIKVGGEKADSVDLSRYTAETPQIARLREAIRSDGGNVGQLKISCHNMLAVEKIDIHGEEKNTPTDAEVPGKSSSRSTKGDLSPGREVASAVAAGGALLRVNEINPRMMSSARDTSEVSCTMGSCSDDAYYNRGRFPSAAALAKAAEEGRTLAELSEQWRAELQSTVNESFR